MGMAGKAGVADAGQLTSKGRGRLGACTADEPDPDLTASPF